MAGVVESRFNKIDQACRRIVQDFAVEDIHVFRVEVKKLRAFLHLAQAGLPGRRSLKLPKRLKKFYDAVGFVRILQLQQQNIGKSLKETGEQVPEAYFNTLGMESAAYMIQAEDLMKDRKSFRREKSYILKKLPCSVSRSEIKEFVRVESERTAGLLKQLHLNDESLHQLRKLLKEILYTWSYTGEYASLFLPAAFNDKSKIAELTDLLGSFHDACIGLNLLGAGRLEKITATEPERILLFNIRREWEEEKENIRNQVLAMLGALQEVPAMEEESKEAI